jgi:SecD/SecF fusion protein
MVALVAIRTNRKDEAPLSGNFITDARVVKDDIGNPSISITMNAEAAMIWKRVTRENIQKAIAIVLDDQVYSYPLVIGEIGGGQSQISGQFKQEEAQDLANTLKAGTLPLNVRIVQEEHVAPSK